MNVPEPFQRLHRVAVRVLKATSFGRDLPDRDRDIVDAVQKVPMGSRHIPPHAVHEGRVTVLLPNRGDRASQLSVVDAEEGIDSVDDSTLPGRRPAGIYDGRVGNTLIHPSLSATAPAAVEPGSDLPIENPGIDGLLNVLHQLFEFLENGLEPDEIVPEPRLVNTILGVVQV